MAGKQFRLFPEPEQPTKVCSRCHARKRTDEFTLRYVGPRGPHYRSKCNPCDLAYSGEWRAKNRSRLNANKRRRYQNNIEREREYIRDKNKKNKAYFVERRKRPGIIEHERALARKRIGDEAPEHRERRLLKRKRDNARIREKTRAYRQRAKDRISAVRSEWRKRNRDKDNEHRNRHRARKRNAAVVENIDRATVITRDGSYCYLCSKKLLPHQVTLDHVIPLCLGGNHSYANIRVACRSCNSAKGTRSLEEYLVRMA